MPLRLRLTLMLAATLVLAAALSAVLLTSAHRGASGAGFEGSLPPADIRLRDFTLHDQDGKVVRLSDYRGQVVMLTFMYSTCRDTCPLTAEQMKGAMDDLGHPVVSLAVSVDPKNDTPLNAKRFINQRGLTKRMEFLLGTRAELEPIWKAYGIQPQGKGFDHTSSVLLLGRDGIEKVDWPTTKLTPESLEHDLRLMGA